MTATHFIIDHAAMSRNPLDHAERCRAPAGSEYDDAAGSKSRLLCRIRISPVTLRAPITAAPRVAGKLSSAILPWRGLGAPVISRQRRATGRRWLPLAPRRWTRVVRGRALNVQPRAMPGCFGRAVVPRDHPALRAIWQRPGATSTASCSRPAVECRNLFRSFGCAADLRKSGNAHAAFHARGRLMRAPRGLFGERHRLFATLRPGRYRREML